MKITVTHNIKLDDIDDIAESLVRDAAYDLADHIIDVTLFTNDKPAGKGASGTKAIVDTGAFITGWSFAVGSGRPRGESSHRKPRRQNPAQKGEEGRELLYNDIARMDFKKVIDSGGFTIRNGTPHSKYIDLKHGYGVEARIRAWQP